MRPKGLMMRSRWEGGDEVRSTSSQGQMAALLPSEPKMTPTTESSVEVEGCRGDVNLVMSDARS